MGQRLIDRQIELLRPREIRAALSASSVIWLPLGAIEWRGEHLPVGSDALIADGLCLAAAQVVGGPVLAPLHFGIGGEHGDYPWSFLMAGGQEVEALLAQTARRLSIMHVERFVVLGGHFAREQLDTIDRFAENWNASGKRPRIIATSIDRCPDTQLAPNQAGGFETPCCRRSSRTRSRSSSCRPSPPLPTTRTGTTRIARSGESPAPTREQST